MKNKSILITFFLGVTIAFAQKKQVYYMDENLEQITKSEFDKDSLNSGEYLKLQFEKDATSTFLKIKRKETGKIRKAVVDSIKSGLMKNANISFQNNDILVINYAPGINPYDASEEINYYQKSRFRKYFRSLKKFNTVQQFFVHKLFEDVIQQESDVIWHSDYKRLIEHTFFKVSLNQGSYVIIDSVGNYYCYRGEYATSDIIKVLDNKDQFLPLYSLYKMYFFPYHQIIYKFLHPIYDH